ncbi:MAG: hypothetical protein HZC41_06440 [Chloroflexi bacterium]|nr:hypothetical protein [Chloroflexota bacterium]
MVRWLLRLALALVIGFTITVGLIRARPYDGSAIRQFLLPPPGCPAPCWQGIRPGITNTDAVLRLLRDNPWVESIQPQFYLGYGNGWITWQWNGSQPPLTARSGQDSVGIYYSTVQNISIMTRIRYGDLLLALGGPDWTKQDVLDRTVYLDNAYLAASFLVKFKLACGVPVKRRWFEPVMIFWTHRLESGGLRTRLPHAATCDA